MKTGAFIKPAGGVGNGGVTKIKKINLQPTNHHSNGGASQVTKIPKRAIRAPPSRGLGEHQSHPTFNQTASSHNTTGGVQLTQTHDNQQPNLGSTALMQVSQRISNRAAAGQSSVEGGVGRLVKLLIDEYYRKKHGSIT